MIKYTFEKSVAKPVAKSVAKPVAKSVAKPVVSMVFNKNKIFFIKLK